MTPNNHYLYDLLRRIGLSDFGARTGEFLLGRPLRILMIGVVAWAVAWIGARAVKRFIRTVHGRSPLRASSPRADLRTTTMAEVMARLVRLATALVAVLLILGVIGIDLGPLLAGASVAGVALGLGAQSLVKDMLAGLFVLSEDQYGVGDDVDLGQAKGTVEEVSLRMTRLRATDGSVWFVPNGQVQRVGNTSMDFGRVTVDVPVSYGVELAKVQAVLREEASAMAADPAWRDSLIDAPEVQGVETLDATGPTLRLVVTTRPDARGAVGRELRRRVVERLATEGLRSA